MWPRRRPTTTTDEAPSAFSPAESALIAQVSPYTMTSPERLVASMDAVTHVVRRGIPGALVECGVWRGGTVLAMIRTLQTLGVTDRDLYLFDTFTGMTRPTAADTSAFSQPALDTWEESAGKGETPWDWVFGDDVFNLDQVRHMLESTGYPIERLHFVEGPVEETLPGHGPAQIALLRLDTDWYESTAHELRHLYPNLTSGGVLIIDDYGHWDGARRAVDEYFSTVAEPMLLTRVDYTGRMGVKG
jgi:hypothetical protein